MDGRINGTVLGKPSSPLSIHPLPINIRLFSAARTPLAQTKAHAPSQHPQNTLILEKPEWLAPAAPKGRERAAGLCRV